MKAVSSLLALHLLCLILCAPLFITYASNAGAPELGPERWTLVATAIVYGLVIVTKRPVSVYDGARKFGLEARIVRHAFIAVLLVILSVPLLDDQDQAIAIVGLALLITSAAVFLRAVKITLSAEPVPHD